MKQTERYISDWEKYAQLPKLPGNADELIRQEVNREREMLRKNRFGDVSESEYLAVYKNGSQQFAVSGNYAYELINMYICDDNHESAIRPAILNGVAYRSEPDEGRCGTLHWTWHAKIPDKWRLCWSSASGWIHASELNQTPDEIMDNIVDEIDAGQTPFTGLNDRPEYQ